MSVENVKRFYEQLAIDEKLRTEVGTISVKMAQVDLQKEMMDRSYSFLEPVLKKAGYDFSLEDIQHYATHLKQEALTSGHHSLKAKDYGGCVCVICGAGKLHDGDLLSNCECVLAGAGGLTAIDGAQVTCACAFGGGGG